MSENTLHKTAIVQHRGREFEMVKLHKGAWRIIDDEGRDFGTIERLSKSGEGGEEVYASVLPGRDGVYQEGNDWRSMAKAAINEVESH